MSMPDFSSELALMIGLGVGIDYALFIVTRYREAYDRNGGDVQRRGRGGDEHRRPRRHLRRRHRRDRADGDVRARRELPLRARGLLVGRGAARARRVAHAAAGAADVLRHADRQAGRARPAPHRAGARTGAASGRAGSPSIQRAPVGRLHRLGRAHARARRSRAQPPARQHRRRQRPARARPRASRYDLLAQGFGKGFSGPLVARRPAPRERRHGRAGQARVGARGRRPASPPSRSRASARAATPRRSRRSPRPRRRARRPRRSSGTSAATSSRRSSRRPAPPPTSAASPPRRSTSRSVLSSKLWLFIGVVVLLSALLLMVVFRSLLIPVQAAAMNLLSIGASMGIVVAVFQWGWLGSVTRDRGRPDRRVPAGDGVRDRVRALDGLRGLPRQPHPRGVDARRRQLGRGARGPDPHRPRDHRRRRRHGRRVRQLHPRRRARDRAVRARARGGRVPRRRS